MKRIIFIVLIATVAMASQALGYTLTFTPATQNIRFGETATVNLNLALDGQETLQGFNFTLGFDSTILQLASFSSVLTSIDTSVPGEYSGIFDNYFGGFTYQPGINPDQLGFNGFFPMTPLTPADGTFTLASVDFTGINLGTSPVTLTGDLDLGMDDLGNFLYYSINESVDVNVVPEPGTCLLLGLGLAGLIGFRKKLTPLRA